MEQLELEASVAQDYLGVSYRRGPAGREPYLRQAPIRSINRWLELTSPEGLAQILDLSGEDLATLERLQKSELLTRLTPLPDDWFEQDYNFLGITIADIPPRPRLVNSRGTDVNQALQWDREAQGNLEVAVQRHSHLSRGQFLSARLFAIAYPKLMTHQG